MRGKPMSSKISPSHVEGKPFQAEEMIDPADPEGAEAREGRGFGEPDVAFGEDVITEEGEILRRAVEIRQIRQAGQTDLAKDPRHRFDIRRRCAPDAMRVAHTTRLSAPGPSRNKVTTRSSPSVNISTLSMAQMQRRTASGAP